MAVTTLVAAPAEAESCVKYAVSGNNRAVVVTNTCGESRRVKVVWERATDSACTQLKALTGQLIDSRGYPANFDRVKSC